VPRLKLEEEEKVLKDAIYETHSCLETRKTGHRLRVIGRSLVSIEYIFCTVVVVLLGTLESAFRILSFHDPNQFGFSHLSRLLFSILMLPSELR